MIIIKKQSQIIIQGNEKEIQYLNYTFDEKLDILENY